MEFEEDEIHLSDKRGFRAEEVAEWYLRLNGIFLIHGFIVHPDRVSRTPRTEADFLGIRLKDSSEGVWRRSNGGRFRGEVKIHSMTDDEVITQACTVGTVKKNLVVMVEVKAGKCSINGPWSDINDKHDGVGQNNMERALSRVGFGNRVEVNAASAAMYQNLRYEGSNFIIQYFSIGQEKSVELENKYPGLKQITFNQIANFLRERFNKFPEKIPENRNILLWRGFGDVFRSWFESNYASTPSEEACQKALKRYIDTGSCLP